MNTDTVQGKKVRGFTELHNHGPGAFFFVEHGRTMICWLPGAGTCSISLRLENETPHPDDDRHPVWTWNGNEEKPTLTPSLHVPGVWHGWLTDGVFKSC